MAFYDQTRPAAAGQSSRAVASFFQSLKADFAIWREARNTRAALNALTDRELDDIGLSRADLDNLTNAQLVKG